MSESIDAALMGIFESSVGFFPSEAALAAMRRAYELGAEQAKRIVEDRAAEAEGNRIACRQDGDLDGAEYWNGMAKGQRDVASRIAALAANQAQPETPKGGETSPRAQSVQAPYEVQAKATGSSPAVPPAPPGLEEQLRGWRFAGHDQGRGSQQMKEYAVEGPAPRKGDTIKYRGTPHGEVSHVDGNLCWVKYYDGQCQPFIWRFRDGLNKLHSWPGKPEEVSK